MKDYHRSLISATTEIAHLPVTSKPLHTTPLLVATPTCCSPPFGRLLSEKGTKGGEGYASQGSSDTTTSLEAEDDIQ